jgi:hypothetical protein
MLATGIRTPVGVKIFGPDLGELERLGKAVEQSVAMVPGTRSAFAERAVSGYYLDIEIDRASAARHGLNVGDIQAVIATAIGGMTVTQTVEGRRRYGVRVRYPQELRDTPEKLAAVLVPVGHSRGGGRSQPVRPPESIRSRFGTHGTASSSAGTIRKKRTPSTTSRLRATGAPPGRSSRSVHYRDFDRSSRTGRARRVPLSQSAHSAATSVRTTARRGRRSKGLASIRSASRGVETWGGLQGHKEGSGCCGESHEGLHANSFSVSFWNRMISA